MAAKLFLAIAAISGFIFVALGAFGAHGLSHVLNEKEMAWLQTGLQYQSIHTLALLVVALMMLFVTSHWLTVGAVCFIIGTLFFSGSLYTMAIFHIKIWPYITPLGGLFFLLGWLALLVSALTLTVKG